MLTINDCVDRYAIELHSQQDIEQLFTMIVEQEITNILNDVDELRESLETHISLKGYAYVRPTYNPWDQKIHLSRGSSYRYYEKYGVEGIDIAALAGDKISLFEMLEEVTG